MTELRQFRKIGHHKCTIRRACLRANEQPCILPAEVERTNVYRCCTAASTIESPSENGNPARETGTQSQASLVEAPDYRRGEDFHRPGHVGKFFYSGVPKNACSLQSRHVVVVPRRQGSASSACSR